MEARQREMVWLRKSVGRQTDFALSLLLLMRSIMEEMDHIHHELRLEYPPTFRQRH